MKVLGFLVLLFGLVTATGPLSHLVTLTCDKSLHLLTESPFEMHINAKSVFDNVINKLGDILHNRVKVNHPEVTKEMFINAFVPFPESFLFHTDEVDVLLEETFTDLFKHFWPAMPWYGSPKITLPSTCNYQMFITTGCFMRLDIARYNFNITFAAQPCGGSNWFPFVDIRCAGEFCSDMGKMCGSSEDCGSNFQCMGGLPIWELMRNITSCFPGRESDAGGIYNGIFEGDAIDKPLTILKTFYASFFDDIVPEGVNSGEFGFCVPVNISGGLILSDIFESQVMGTEVKNEDTHLFWADLAEDNTTWTITSGTSMTNEEGYYMNSIPSYNFPYHADSYYFWQMDMSGNEWPYDMSFSWPFVYPTELLDHDQWGEKTPEVRLGNLEFFAIDDDPGLQEWEKQKTLFHLELFAIAPTSPLCEVDVMVILPYRGPDQEHEKFVQNRQCCPTDKFCNQPDGNFNFRVQFNWNDQTYQVIWEWDNGKYSDVYPFEGYFNYQAHNVSNVTFGRYIQDVNAENGEAYYDVESMFPSSYHFAGGCIDSCDSHINENRVTRSAESLPLPVNISTYEFIHENTWTFGPCPYLSSCEANRGFEVGKNFDGVGSIHMNIGCQFNGIGVPSSAIHVIGSGVNPLITLECNGQLYNGSFPPFCDPYGEYRTEVQTQILLNGIPLDLPNANGCCYNATKDELQDWCDMDYSRDFEIQYDLDVGKVFVEYYYHDQKKFYEIPMLYNDTSINRIQYELLGQGHKMMVGNFAICKGKCPHTLTQRKGEVMKWPSHMSTTMNLKTWDGKLEDGLTDVTTKKLANINTPPLEPLSAPGERSVVHVNASTAIVTFSLSKVLTVAVRIPKVRDLLSTLYDQLRYLVNKKTDALSATSLTDEQFRTRFILWLPELWSHIVPQTDADHVAFTNKWDKGVEFDDFLCMNPPDWTTNITVLPPSCHLKNVLFNKGKCGIGFSNFTTLFEREFNIWGVIGRDLLGDKVPFIDIKVESDLVDMVNKPKECVTDVGCAVAYPTTLCTDLDLFPDELDHQEFDPLATLMWNTYTSISEANKVSFLKDLRAMVQNLHETHVEPTLPAALKFCFMNITSVIENTEAWKPTLPFVNHPLYAPYCACNWKKLLQDIDTILVSQV